MECIQCFALLFVAKDGQKFELNEAVLFRVWSMVRSSERIDHRFCLSGKETLQTHHTLIVDTKGRLEGSLQCFETALNIAVLI